MSLAIQAIQQALYNKLTGDGVLMGMLEAVYDIPTQRSPLPYAMIADAVQEELPVVGQTMWQLAVTLEVWTDATGRRTALTVLERLNGLLHHGSLSIGGFELLEMRVLRAQCELAENAARVVGSLEVRLVVRAS